MWYFAPVKIGLSLWKAWRIGGSIIQKSNLPAIRALRPAWNKGRIVGQKRPLRPKHLWAIRVRLELAENHRDLALFNLAIGSKLRGCDLIRMKVVDVTVAAPTEVRNANLAAVWERR